jgi:hypothetical protein
MMNPLSNKHQKEIKSLTSQVNVLKKILVKNLFKNKEELETVLKDVW